MPQPQIPVVTTTSGVAIPQLGFGTYKVTENAQAIVESAIDVGYRHLDTAQMYRNEGDVGRAWNQSGLPREAFFLTSKLDNPNHEAPVARDSFARTLDELQTDYVDLFLIHWPLPNDYGGDFGATWEVLEGFLEDGRARAIGLSNFEPSHVERVLETASHKPTVNQVESHPFFPNDAVHAFDHDHGIVTQAWSPLGRGTVLDNPVIQAIALETEKTPAQVVIRWGLQRGDVLFPKATSRARQKENLDVFDFELSPAQMERIFALDKGETGRRGSHPQEMSLP